MKNRYKLIGFDPFGYLSENPEPNVKLQFLVKGLTGAFCGYSIFTEKPDLLVTIGIVGFFLDTFCSCLVFQDKQQQNSQ